MTAPVERIVRRVVLGLADAALLVAAFVAAIIIALAEFFAPGVFKGTKE